MRRIQSLSDHFQMHLPLAGIDPIDLIGLSLRQLVNLAGLAWWAEVKTTAPDAIYWFGPFVRRYTMERQLMQFLDDLRAEGALRLDVSKQRIRRFEPLTLEGHGVA